MTAAFASQTTRRQALALTGLAALSATSAAAAQAVAPVVAPVVADDDLTGPWTGGGDVGVVGGTLRYRTLGPADGEPLVLLPKLGGWIADWRFAAPALAARRRVIAFDLPGHGGSAMRGPPPPIVTVPECTAMVLAAIDHLGIDRFAIAGNSAGGIVGIVAAVWSPDRVSRLVVVSSSLIDIMTRDAIDAQDRNPNLPGAPSSYAADGRPLPPTDEQNRLFGTMDPRVIREQALSRTAAGPWLRACERGVGRAGVTSYLPRITVPTLMINADRGRYVKFAEVGKRLIPGVQAVVIANAGSFVHQEKPAEVAAAMNAFLG